MGLLRFRPTKQEFIDAIRRTADKVESGEIKLKEDMLFSIEENGAVAPVCAYGHLYNELDILIDMMRLGVDDTSTHEPIWDSLGILRSDLPSDVWDKAELVATLNDAGLFNEVPQAMRDLADLLEKEDL